MTGTPLKIPLSPQRSPSCGFPEETEAGFYKRMDDALYLAKEGGRNRIILLDAEHQVKEVTRE